MSITPITQEFNDDEDSFLSMMNSIVAEETSKGNIYDTPETPNNIPTTLNDEDDDFFNFINREKSKIASEKEFNLNAVDIQNPVKKDEGVANVEKLLQTDNPSPSGVNEGGYTDDVYSAAFDFIKETGLLNVPENLEFSSENLQQILQYDQDVRNQAALEYIKAQAGDEAIANLFDLVWDGGTINDLENAKNIVSDEQFFRNLDLNNESNQKQILVQFFKEGLNPNAPTYQLLVDELPSRVDNIIAQYKGAEEAEKAREYFLTEISKAKNEFEKQKIERIKQEEAVKIKKLQREENWRKQFLNGLAGKNWSSEKKNEVLSHFDTVVLEDGTKLPLWDFKMKKIWENPENAQVLFRFLSDFDEYKLQFKTQDKTPTQLATSKILEMANKKATSKTINTDNIQKTPLDDRQVTDEDLAKFINARGSSGATLK